MSAIRVLRGAPTPEEVAALVAVLALIGGGAPAGDAGRPRLPRAAHARYHSPGSWQTIPATPRQSPSVTDRY